MNVRPHRTINRKKTKLIKVGKVSVGAGSTITVQSMTNTLTTDVSKTIDQINDLEKAGADIVRVSCPDENSTKSFKEIVNNVNVPIVADIPQIEVLVLKCLIAAKHNSTWTPLLEPINSCHSSTTTALINENLFFQSFEEIINCKLSGVVTKILGSLLRCLFLSLAEVSPFLTPTERFKLLSVKNSSIEIFICWDNDLSGVIHKQIK